jgi:hypothetical protein
MFAVGFHAKLSRLGASPTGSVPRENQHFAIRRPEIPVERVGSFEVSGKFTVDLKSRHAVPGTGGGLNEPVICDTWEPNLGLDPFCCLSHAPERTDLHPERLVIGAERVAEQACDMICLFDTKRGQGCDASIRKHADCSALMTDCKARIPGLA